jgi:hypothetical protein
MAYQRHCAIQIATPGHFKARAELKGGQLATIELPLKAFAADLLHQLQPSLAIGSRAPVHEHDTKRVLDKPQRSVIARSFGDVQRFFEFANRGVVGK